MVIKPPRKSGRLERRSIDVKNKIHLMEKYIVEGSQLRPGGGNSVIPKKAG